MSTEQPSKTSGQRNEFLVCYVCNEVAPKVRVATNRPRNQKLPAVKSKPPEGRAAYTVEEIAWRHGVSKKTVYRWIYRGLLPVSKASRKLLVPAGAVDNFMAGTL